MRFQDTSPSEGEIAFMHAGEEIGVKVSFEPHRSTTIIPQADLSRQTQDLTAPLPYVLIVTALFLFTVGLLPKRRR